MHHGVICADTGVQPFPKDPALLGQAQSAHGAHCQIYWARLGCGCVVAFMRTAILNVIWICAVKLQRLSMVY